MDSATTIVIFGASGDLTSHKLIPALYENFVKKRLPPRTQILGISRTPMSDEAFRKRLLSSSSEVLGKENVASSWSEFAPSVHYYAADVSKEASYPLIEQAVRELEGSNPSRRIYYLALAPELYLHTIEYLGKAGMARPDGGWRRIIIEKPFGRDLTSTRVLNQKLHAVFDESQVYRIDHYLGKETIQNLLVLRFANTIFEPVWNRNFIEHVQITVAEAGGIGSRAGYYETAGVLRDVFQNHLLQLLTLIAMEIPSRFEANTLRDEKVKVLDAVRLPKSDDVEQYSVLGQYQGYHSESGVAPDSRTPTFAALRLNIDNWRWQDVPFYLRSGKAMAAKMSEAVIQFRCPPHMIFDVPRGETLHCNQLVVTVQPDEGIHLTFMTKVPDAGMKLHESNLYFHYRDSYEKIPVLDSYERLLLDAIKGDASLFIRQDEIERAWQIIDPVIEGWSARTASSLLPQYPRGSWGPAEADALLKQEGRSWVNGASLHHDR